MNRAVFLDRDGVINEERPDSVKTWNEFDFYPKTIKALKLLSGTDYKIVIITNQAGIGRGRYTEEVLNEIHEKMLYELSKDDVRVDMIKYCPHLDEDGCKNRKPNPGMILSAKDELDLDLDKSWLVGDKTVDIKTVENVNKLGYTLKSILVKTGYGGSDAKFEVNPDYIAEDILGAVNIILNS